jgi:hypothetical protein
VAAALLDFRPAAMKGPGLFSDIGKKGTSSSYSCLLAIIVVISL